MATRNQFINDNFSIFLDGVEDKYKYDVHINDWLVYPIGNYIDFGIRIYNISNVNVLYVYVPYKIDAEDIQDLAPLFGIEKIARALVNTSANIITSTSSPVIEINYYNITESIVFLSLLNVSIRMCENGTIIQFLFKKAHSYIKNKNCYIRFRIPHKSLDEIFSYKRHDYKFLFDSPIITDKYQHTIKINEYRALPFEVRQIFSLHNQCINKVLFFLSSIDEINIDNNICENVRPLEPDLLGL